MNKIKKNFIYNAMYQILTILFPLLTMPYISRIIGAKGVGIYTYTYAIAGYFALFAMLGINSYGNRRIAQVQENKEKLSKEFSSIYTLQFIISSIVIIIYVIYTCILVKENQIFAIIQTIYLLSNMFDISWFYYGIEEFKKITIKNIAIKIVTVIAIFLFVKQSEDLLKYTIIMATSFLLSNLVLWTFLEKFVKFKIPKIIEIKKHIKPTIILFIPLVANGLFKIIDKIMLGNMVNIAETGYYDMAEKIISLPDTIIRTLSTVMMPRMANLIATNKENKSKEYLKKSMTFSMILAIPIWLGILTLSDEFIPIFLGKEFSKTSDMLKILSFSIPFFMWGNVIRMQYLIPSEKDKQYTLSVVIGVIINIIFNIILIPKYEGQGAAIATVIAEFVTILVQGIQIRKELELLQYFKIFLKFLLKGIIMYIAINLLKYFITGDIKLIVIQIVSGILIYFVLNYKEIAIMLKGNYKSI